jgi:hypothetical protein
VLAKAAKKGELQAVAENKSKIWSNKKQRTAWMLTQLEKVIDKIDPMKALAILGTTLIIKQGINWAQYLGQKFAEQGGSPVGMVAAILGDLMPGNPVLEALAGITGEKKVNLGGRAEIMEWVISFTVAYILVEHAGELITAGGNILFAAKGLIGGLLAA